MSKYKKMMRQMEREQQKLDTLVRWQTGNN